MSPIIRLVAIITISSFCLPLPLSTGQAAQDVGFQVGPTSFNTIIAVGDETNETITLQNNSRDEVVVKAHIQASGNPADPNITLPPEQLSLKPGATATVVVKLKIPDEAEPGHRVASVLFDAAASSERDVSIVGQVGVVFSIEVIRPVADVRWSFPRLIDSSEQVVFGMEGRNTGNFTTKLQGEANVGGVLGGEVDLQAASGPLAVGETAFLQAVWDEAPIFAIKRVTLDLSSGIGAPVEQKAILVVFPWKLTLMLAFMSAIAAAGAGFQPKLAKVFSENGRREG